MEKHVQRRLLSGEEIIKGNEAKEVQTYELMSLMHLLKWRALSSGEVNVVVPAVVYYWSP